jgi:hypothetical protein
LGLAVVPCMQVCVCVRMWVCQGKNPYQLSARQTSFLPLMSCNILCLVHISFTSAQQQWFSHSLATLAQTEPVCGFINDHLCIN